MDKRFTITRSDGRSNAQVILDHVKDGEPGRVYPHAELLVALDVGSDRAHTRPDVYHAVRTALPRVLREHQRRLHAVRQVGYRLARASEHVSLARCDRHRADVQLKRGLATLQNVMFDEMTPNERSAHEGTLMVVSALWANQAAMDRRLRKVEMAIASVR